MPRLSTVVMVPKGAEFKAIEKGLNSAQLGIEERKSWEIVSLPVGPIPVKSFVSQWCEQRKQTDSLNITQVILMGLCGSLTQELNVNDVVIYQRCLNGVAGSEFGPVNHSFDLSLPSDKFSLQAVTIVTGVMCDRVISEAAAKVQLAQKFSAQVVDMEGIAALQELQHYGIDFSMIRVVSDDVHHDLPDLNDAFDIDGNIRPWVMTRQFLLNPSGALRLIRGSLSALKTLENVARIVFSSESRGQD